MISQGPSVCLFNKQDPQEVLAAWLFLQYLLTDGIQTDYAETEGYVPVTTSAQTSDSYRDYLSRSGEDTDAHYRVKIDATNMLLAHTDDTFVTPVFNGSTSLRNALGQLIEEVTRARRANETVDDAFLQKAESRCHRPVSAEPERCDDESPGGSRDACRAHRLHCCPCWVGRG